MTENRNTEEAIAPEDEFLSSSLNNLTISSRSDFCPPLSKMLVL